MDATRFTLITGLTVTLAACATSRSTIDPDYSTTLLRDDVRVAAGGPSDRTGGARPAAAPLPRDAAAAASAGTLNLKLLEQSARSADDRDLPVGAGDLLEVSVFEVEELSKIRLRVPWRGVIALPLLGQIQATGRTTAELEEEIRTRLQQKFMHDPQVSVFLQEHNSQRISVIGAVRKGGVFNLSRPLRLADALALAEGVTDEADRIVYVIRRVPGEVGANGAAAGKRATTAEAMAPIDISELADGREDLNIPLRAGDVVHVPRAGSVYVGGSVERAGSFMLRGKTTVQQAIFAAGGVKDVADWSDVRLYRKSASGDVEVNKYDLQAFEDGRPAPELQRNDVVIVGKSGGKAFFYGFLDFFKGAMGVSKGL
jgi:polysaccharide biosynthesis/export protein